VEILEASPSWSHTALLYRWLYYSKDFNHLQQRNEHLNRWLSFSFPALFLVNLFLSVSDSFLVSFFLFSAILILILLFLFF